MLSTSTGTVTSSFSSRPRADASRVKGDEDDVLYYQMRAEAIYQQQETTDLQGNLCSSVGC